MTVDDGPPDDPLAMAAALHAAVFAGDAEATAALLPRTGANCRDRHGQTPLFFAPHAAMCAQLLEAKADVDAVNDHGQSALHLAAHAGLGETVEWLATHMNPWMLDLLDVEGRTAYYLAARLGQAALAQLLQRRGADVTLKPAARRPAASGSPPPTPSPAMSRSRPQSPASLTKLPREGMLQRKKFSQQLQLKLREASRPGSAQTAQASQEHGCWDGAVVEATLRAASVEMPSRADVSSEAPAAAAEVAGGSSPPETEESSHAAVQAELEAAAAAESAADAQRIAEERLAQSAPLMAEESRTGIAA